MMGTCTHVVAEQTLVDRCGSACYQKTKMETDQAWLNISYKGIRDLVMQTLSDSGTGYENFFLSFDNQEKTPCVSVRKTMLLHIIKMVKKTKTEVYAMRNHLLHHCTYIYIISRKVALLFSFKERFQLSYPLTHVSKESEIIHLELFGEQLRSDLNAPRVGPLSNTAKPTAVYLFDLQPV